MQQNNQRHSAKYLVLLGHDNEQRALLFSGDHHYLAEMFDDDGFTLDNLMRSGSQLREPPDDLPLDSVIPKSLRSARLQCYALGARS